MPNRRLKTMDVRSLLVHLRSTTSNRQVSRETGVARVTVGRYRRWAQEQGLLSGALLPLDELQGLLDQTLPKLVPPQNESSVERYRDLVTRLCKEGVEAAAIHARLQERGFDGSYSAVYRFIRSLEPREPEAVVRVETRPGEEAQVDFGEVRAQLDPATLEPHKTWAFVMTLSWSRHSYVEFVFDQRVETWLLCHVHAFDYFEGVVKRITTDNLKAAIIRAAWDEPIINRSYAECAEHYGFLIAPCRPRTPQHKGKVESGVHYVQRNFMGGREPTAVDRANRDVRQWCLEAAGQRDHGTTHERPMERFEQTERQQLQVLPATAYDLGVFKRGKLHRDCHLVSEQSYYSAPFRLVGQQLWLRAGLGTVRIYNMEHQLVATHERARRPGEWHTHPDHLPPHKVPGMMLSRELCMEQARKIGPSTQQVVEEILSDRVRYRVPVAGRVLRLADEFTAARLEAACMRALHFGDPAWQTIKRMLAESREAEPLSSPAMPLIEDEKSGYFPPVFTYARPPEQMLGHLLERTEKRWDSAEDRSSSDDGDRWSPLWTEEMATEGGSAWN